MRNRTPRAGLAELAGALEGAIAGRGRLLLLALVEVDGQTRTSVPGVYAAGDVAVAPQQMAATESGHLAGIAAVRELVFGPPSRSSTTSGTSPRADGALWNIQWPPVDSLGGSGLSLS